MSEIKIFPSPGFPVDAWAAIEFTILFTSSSIQTILELISTPHKDTESTDAEILDDFNKIKSGEVSRMSQKNSN